MRVVKPRNLMDEIETEVRLLCTLGLPPEHLMLELNPLLHQLIPSQVNCFLWSDEKGSPTRVFHDPLRDNFPMKLYLEEFCNKLEKAAILGYAEFLRQPNQVECLFQSNPELEKTQFYHEIFSPLQIHHSLRTAIGNSLSLGGLLCLNRDKSYGGYTPKEVHLLQGLAPFISYGMSIEKSHAVQAGKLFEPVDEAIVIMDGSGKIQFASEGGQEILAKADHGQFIQKSDASYHFPEGGLFTEIKNICSQLQHSFHGEKSTVPILEVENGWGKFHFKAFWLETPVSDQSGVIGLMIEHHRDIRPNLIKSAQSQGLTEQETRVAVHFLSGLTHNHIATKLKISRHTSISHLRNIYEKLEVTNSAELLAGLKQNVEVSGGFA